jgi:hypothetical protein
MYRVTVYRHDSIEPVVYENVKHVWSMDGGHVLAIFCHTGSEEVQGKRQHVPSHDYILWLTEHVSHVQVEHI